MRQRPRGPALVVAVLGGCLLLGACSNDASSTDRTSARTRAQTETALPSPPEPPTPRSSATSTPTTNSTPTPDSAPSPSDAPPATTERGIDVSHVQGVLDWEAVARDDVHFAYLKATEGATFVDPAFDGYRGAARQAGLAVGGYHYYSWCTPALPQAENFLAVLGSTPGSGAAALPPAVDLEEGGECGPGSRPEALREVRTFLARLRAAGEEEVLVYVFPDLEARLHLSHGLASDPATSLWVRRLGDRPPPEPWTVWQRDDRATVAGVPGPVDLDVRRR